MAAAQGAPRGLTLAIGGTSAMRDSPGGDDDGAHSDEGFLIEFVALGNAVKVSAIDPATGTEVSILGAATASRHDLM
ncbi:MAG: hypothetical protein D6782_13755, partial [Alphaproteobacteria bacterium]